VQLLTVIGAILIGFMVYGYMHRDEPNNDPYDPNLGSPY